MYFRFDGKLHVLHHTIIFNFLIKLCFFVGSHLHLFWVIACTFSVIIINHLIKIRNNSVKFAQ